MCQHLIKWGKLRYYYYYYYYTLLPLCMYGICRCTPKPNLFLKYIVLQLFSVHSTCNVTFQVSVCYFHIGTECQIGRFPVVLYFVLSRYLAQVLSEWCWRFSVPLPLVLSLLVLHPIWLLLVVSRYVQHFWAPTVSVIWLVSSGNLCQGILKWTYKARNMVNWHEYGVLLLYLLLLLLYYLIYLPHNS